jgi:tRNA threonylcarbamoyladenosine biosynthesis protein TsaE
MFCISTSSPQETQGAAAALSVALMVGDLVVLSGDLGAGKTCFVKGLAFGLGVSSPVTSPTFTLANEYEGRVKLHHLDVYRLNSASEALDLDIDYRVESGVTVVEWGEKISGALPAKYLKVTIDYGEVLQSDPNLEGNSSRLIRFDFGFGNWQDRAQKSETLLREWVVPC